MSDIKNINTPQLSYEYNNSGIEFKFSFIIILIIIITGCSVSNEDKINKLIENTVRNV